MLHTCSTVVLSEVPQGVLWQLVQVCRIAVRQLYGGGSRSAELRLHFGTCCRCRYLLVSRFLPQAAPAMHVCVSPKCAHCICWQLLLPGPGLSGCLEGGCLVGRLEEASAELQGSLRSQQQYSHKLGVQLYMCLSSATSKGRQ
jgi:hypothetical protein